MSRKEHYSRVSVEKQMRRALVSKEDRQARRQELRRQTGVKRGK